MEKNKRKVCEIKDIRTLVKAIKSEEVGWFGYRSKKIFIGYKKGIDEKGQTRKQRLYRQRRNNGLCVACGKKITKINPQTGKLFRLCDYHREKIDRKVK